MVGGFGIFFPNPFLLFLPALHNGPMHFLPDQQIRLFLFFYKTNRYLLIGLAAFLGSNFANAQLLTTPPFQPANLELQIKHGEELSRQYCVACHEYPDPGLLDRQSWVDGALPWMRMFHGFDPERVDKSPEGKLLRATGRFPTEPILSENDWKSIVAFYTHTSQEALDSNFNKNKIRPSLTLFDLQPAQFPSAVPMTTLLSWQSQSNALAMGDARLKQLIWMNADGTLKSRLNLKNIPVQITPTISGEGYWVVGIGSFFPSERRQGEILQISEDKSSGEWKVEKKLTQLSRPTHIVETDLNHDGQPDLAIAQFGNFQGRFSWWEMKENSAYEEHVLFGMPGALRSVTGDFDKNGTQDLMILVAQETESLMVFWNDGKGNFEQEILFKKPSSFGHSFFEMVDFDGDGQDEILVTNGDNGDYGAGYKNYHGIRVYSWKPGKASKPVEEFFFPLNGAYKALARDFDKDGDLDIAAVSFFPNYQESPLESFVYLENQGTAPDWEAFQSITFDKALAGRWLSLDAADIDQDGALDLALGSVVQGPSAVPPALARIWKSNHLGALLLMNRTRD